MKTYINKQSLVITLLVLLAGTAMVRAQKAFKHVAKATTIRNHITSINNAETNGKKDKILFVTHDYGKSGPYHTEAFGVWFNGTKWTIFNQNRAALKPNTKFNVLVMNKGANVFTHTASPGSMMQGATKINHASLNGKPNANFIIMQNYGTKGPYNPNPTGIGYAGGRWYIFNTNGKPIPKGAKFNILIHSSIFRHKVTTASRKRHITYVNNTKTNNKQNDLIFATFNSQGSRKNFNNPIGVWYTSGKWTVFNENRSLLKGNEAYNMLNFNSMKLTKALIYTLPKDRVYVRKPPVVIKKETPKTVNSTGLTNIGLVKYYPISTTTTSTNTERLGPDITKYEDLESVLEGDVYESFFEKLNVFRKLYKDKNPNSNVLYYFPAEYTLKWDKTSNEYAFNVYYMSSDEGSGSVLINAELTPHIGNKEIDLAESLLAKQLRKPIKLMPMDLRDVPKVAFGATLTNFNVKEESINASVPSDYHKPIILDWRMDSNVDDFVGAMLNNVGVNVNLEFRPYGDETTVISVPVNLEVNSPVTFGKIQFNTAAELRSGWTNTLDYPVIPYNLVVLRKRGNNKYFENIPLTSDEIAVDGTFTPDAVTSNRLNTGNPIQELWIDYSLNKDCNECNQEVKRKIIGGTSGSQISNVEIQVLNALEYADAHSMKLLIKSVQADPNGVNEITFPAINISEDNQALQGNQLFVPEDKELSFNYQVVMIMKDGKVRTSKWKESNTSLLVLGESQIDDLFPATQLDELQQAKDSIIDKGTKDLIEKGKDLLDSLLNGKKKEEDPKENEENEENEN
ncbi:hypothetical protein [Ascidiimonas sp. W6]|uniref:DUF7452 domain-containing protein n=1 Tax=Ascidiimonas meishanensis TaxID=3128903 RepID=UPI0030ED27EC